MTDNEIIKALECCVAENEEECKVNCPYKGNMTMCVIDLPEKSLDLINRQKAENEKLTYEVDSLNAYVQHMYRRGWAEAVKALTDKLKAIPIFEYHGDHIDKVAKDMMIREMFKEED